jgi:hypothetical protein
MPKEEEQRKKEGSEVRTLNKFLPCGEFSPITNRQECEQRLNALPPEQREFAEESTRFADIWQYFSDRRMQLPRDVVDQVSGLPTLPKTEQIAVMRRVNQALMEYLNAVGENSWIRQ